ncbi:uncharacterized protein [Haliotis cracherodii]|uniref:uncharacterized protein n=1 Tax=Haliotis cracherodii TaxID=6455 RepID=UPI0039ED10A4
MFGKTMSGCIAMVLVSMATAQSQQGMTPCQNNFVQNLNTCVQNSQMVFNNFLYLLTNGTNGQAPDSPDTFRQDACSKQEALLLCGVEFMRTLINSTMCAPSQTQQDQRPLIDRQFRSLFGSLDAMCAHPCRRTLTEDLRQCYVDANLDPTLFLSNSTMGRGAIIGTTADQADIFCKNKDSLVTCMKQKRDDCPESPMILRAIGLDIESMDKGVGVLCAHPDVYLNGIDCFAEPTDAVVSCQQTMNQKTMELMMTAEQQNLKEDQFFNRFCDVRLEHVSCDLEAWSKKNHKSCADAVIGLRTELECGLLPDNCGATHKQTIDQVCHHENFKKDMRPFNSATTFSIGTMSCFMLRSVLTYSLNFIHI